MLLYYHPRFFNERVERLILPPSQLYWRVRAVYLVFGEKRDSKSMKPLFDKEAWKKANQVLREILLGYYSDLPGYNLYTQQLNKMGTPKVDKHGIQLLHCCRGTNAVENLHRMYRKTFSNSMTGIEYGSNLLLHRVHRHNIRMGRSHVPGYPWLGHYDTWLIDKLKRLVEKVLGIIILPGYVSPSDYKTTPESFQTVALHTDVLHQEIQQKEIDPEITKKYSSDIKFLCKAMGVRMPFLPLTSPAEFKLFTKLMMEKKKYDSAEFALEFTRRADGQNIFPKLEVYMNQYYKRWERNRRVQDAVKNMVSYIAKIMD